MLNAVIEKMITMASARTMKLCLILISVIIPYFISPHATLLHPDRKRRRDEIPAFCFELPPDGIHTGRRKDHVRFDWRGERIGSYHHRHGVEHLAILDCQWWKRCARRVVLTMHMEIPREVILYSGNVHRSGKVWDKLNRLAILGDGVFDRRNLPGLWLRIIQ